MSVDCPKPVDGPSSIIPVISPEGVVSVGKVFIAVLSISIALLTIFCIIGAFYNIRFLKKKGVDILPGVEAFKRWKELKSKKKFEEYLTDDLADINQHQFTTINEDNRKVDEDEESKTKQVPVSTTKESYGTLESKN